MLGEQDIVAQKQCKRGVTLFDVDEYAYYLEHLKNALKEYDESIQKEVKHSYQVVGLELMIVSGCSCCHWWCAC